MDLHQVQQVRRFNRVVTQRIGALDESYLRRGRPLGEARLIFETGREGADVRALRTRLGLDSGYLSRLLRSLETQRLVMVGRQPGDGRGRRGGVGATGAAGASDGGGGTADRWGTHRGAGGVTHERRRAPVSRCVFS